jgi:hypothetical protein
MPTALIIVMALTALITTAMVEGAYFACHLWRRLFDCSAISFSWVEPLPATGISTAAVLLVGFVTARLMSRASREDLHSIDAHLCMEL